MPFRNRTRSTGPSGGGRMRGNRPGSGPGGSCVCLNCGTRVPHQRGLPCYDITCPKCGTKMTKNKLTNNF